MSAPAQQEWVVKLPIMQQSVLFAAVRAPDGVRKDHPVKVMMRWYRRCVLMLAFEQRRVLEPYWPGGGSFTGPLTAQIMEEFGLDDLDDIRGLYLRYVDELPHHFQLHLMHAAEIVGYKHDVERVRKWWLEFYRMIVQDAHLFPETEDIMDHRLSDDGRAWQSHEVVRAQ